MQTSEYLFQIFGIIDQQRRDARALQSIAKPFEAVVDTSDAEPFRYVGEAFTSVFQKPFGGETAALNVIRNEIIQLLHIGAAAENQKRHPVIFDDDAQPVVRFQKADYANRAHRQRRTVNLFGNGRAIGKNRL